MGTMAVADSLKNHRRKVMLVVCQRCDDKTDLSGLCRICLLYLHPNEMTQIFPSVSTDSWKATIQNVTNIEVFAGDGLPALVCSLCVSKLKQIKEFKEKSAASNYLLRNILLQNEKVLERPSKQLCVDIGAVLPHIKQHEDITDMSGLCRLCITCLPPDDMTPIFCDSGLDSLSDKITSVTNIKVARGDGLPASICDRCVTRLRQASEFIADAGAKDLYLRTELFQVKREICQADELDVKQEPDDAANDLMASDMPRVRIKTEPGNDHDLQDGAELGMLTDFAQCPLSNQWLGSEPANGQVSESDLRKRLRFRSKAAAKTLQCDGCLANFRTQEAFKKHLPCKIENQRATRKRNSGKNVKLDVRQSERVQCQFCKKMYASKNTLARHVKVLHQLNKQLLKCDRCEQTFTCRASLNEHQLDEHQRMKPKRYECDLCKKTFNGKSTCARHLAIHMEVDIEKSVQCDFCEEKFWTMSICEKHMETHSDVKRLKCLVCGKRFKFSSQRKKHQVVHSTEKPHKCDTCNKSFKRAQEVKLHMTIHSTEKPFVCKICGRRFSRDSTAKNHMFVHSDERTVACDQCEKKFKNHQSLMLHMKVHSVRPFECKVCGRFLTSSTTYNNHMRLHTGDLPFTCKVCEKSFPNNRAFTVHMETHEDRKREFRCHICNRMYYNKHGLAKHLATHKERPKVFKCAICPSSYIKKSSLECHILYRHTKERPHKCSSCSKSYVSKTKLANHMTTHTGEKPYQCELCKKKFSTKYLVRAHMKIHIFPKL